MSPEDRSQWLCPEGNEGTLALTATLTVVLLATVFAVGSVGSVHAAQTDQDGHPASCLGTMDRPANGTTLISVQGAKGGEKKPARVVAVGPQGSIEWVHHSGREDTVDAGNIVWSYDVDPLPSGEIFVTATIPGDTVLYAFDPTTGAVTWQVHRPALDTHDADVLPNGRIAVANMRNYDQDAEENRDRVYVLDRETNETVWQWSFADHFGREAGGEYSDDWTHVNDIDRVGEDRFLVSPRNLDQVLLIDRSSGEIVWRLGQDGNHSILKKQHNPDYLPGIEGQDTVLVADSENDRIVEYARVGGDAAATGGEWNRTWHLAGDFHWPRDADRLPNGNTLVTDSRNHRVLEVTPEGEVVWEVYTPWLPYDAERVRTGDGSNGPTARQQGAPASVEVRGASGGHDNEDRLATCAAAYRNAPDPGAAEWTPGAATPQHTLTDTARSTERRATTGGPPAGTRPAPSTAVGAAWPVSTPILAVVAGAIVVLARRR